MSEENQEEVPERLSFTSRPALWTALVLSGVLLMMAMYGWYAIGQEVRDQITWAQVATLLGIVLAMIAIMLSVGLSRMWAEGDKVVVRNGLRIRRYELSQIAGLRLRSGDPWAYLLIKSPSGLVRRPMLAIQQLEGAGGQAKLRELRAWLKANGATSRDVVT